MYSTTNDLCAWYRALQGGRFFELGKLPHPYGWEVRETEAKKKYLEKDGRIPGFVSNFSMFLDEDLVVILLGNLEDAAVNSMAMDLAAIALGASVPPPPPRSAAPAPVPQVHEYSDVYEVNPSFLLRCARAHPISISGVLAAITSRWNTLARTRSSTASCM